MRQKVICLKRSWIRLSGLSCDVDLVSCLDGLILDAKTLKSLFIISADSFDVALTPAQQLL
jgi:hypothetical protein